MDSILVNDIFELFPFVDEVTNEINKMGVLKVQLSAEDIEKILQKISPKKL